MEGLVLAGLIVGAAVVAMWLLATGRRSRARYEGLHEIARTLGLKFHSEGDIGGHTRLQFPLFHEGSYVTVTNTITGEIDGNRITVFDVTPVFETEVEGAPMNAYGIEEKRTHMGGTSTCGIIELPAMCPELHMFREDIATRIANSALGSRGVEFESEAFNRTWNVQCADARFASTLLSAQVLDLIVERDPRVDIEVRGWYLLASGPHCDAVGVLRLVEFMRDLRRLVPPLLSELYPRAR